MMTLTMEEHKKERNNVITVGNNKYFEFLKVGS